MNKSIISIISGAVCTLLVPFSAQAGEFTYVSPQYSAERFIPHFHYEGVVVEEDADALIKIYSKYVHCEDECFDADGAAAAIISMDSPGGSYITGLRMAEIMRAGRIATIVENGKGCYSACAFAFLGGTGFSTQEGVGEYIDRTVEPGGVVGFHAPYFPDKALTGIIEDIGLPTVMNESREMISLMIDKLVNWNVDPSVMAHMVSMGADEMYRLLTPEDMFLVRAGLPKAPIFAWQPDQAEGIRNVCIRLLALHKSISLDEAADLLADATFEMNFGKTKFGTALSGYAIADTATFGINHCGVEGDLEAAKTSSNYDVSLLTGPGIDGSYNSAFSFFNRHDGWSTAGTGDTARKRIFQKGSLSHYFLPYNTNIGEMENSIGVSLLLNKFFTLFPPQLPTQTLELNVLRQDKRSRVSSVGDILVFEYVGTANLFDTAREKLVGLGATITHDAGNDNLFIKSGTYDNGRGGFSWIGFKSAAGAALVRIELSRNPSDQPLATEDLAALRAIACGLTFEKLKLSCS